MNCWRSNLAWIGVVLLTGCGDGRFSAFGGKGADDDTIEATEAKKPSEEGEGVPGYLTDPKLVEVKAAKDQTTADVSGLPGAIASFGGDVSEVPVYVWQVERTELRKLTSPDKIVDLLGTLKASTVAHSDGSFAVNIQLEPTQAILISTQGDPERGPTIDRTDGSKISGALIQLGTLDVAFGLGSGEFGDGDDLPGSYASNVVVALQTPSGSGILRVTKDFELIWQPSDGNKSFADSVVLDTLPNSAASIAVGDVNSDGFNDFITGPDGAALRVYLGEETGFSPSQEIASGAYAHEKLRLRDVNGDKRLDLIAAQGKDQPNTLYLGNGDGTFGVETELGPAPTNATLAIAAGDFNGDGHSDLVAATWSQSPQLLINDGQGTFSTSHELALDGESICREIVAADFDNDGDLDLFTADKNNNFVFLNDGKGSFEKSKPLGEERNSVAAAAADLNGDGAIDLIVKNHASRSQLFLNHGDATFASGRDLGSDVLTGDYASSLTLADFNADKILDIVLSNPGSAGSDRIFFGK